jgi:hypothetical protein
MHKRSYFASQMIDGWPRPKDIERYFLAPPGQRWFFETRNDGAHFILEGAEGTSQLAEGWGGRIDITLMLWGHPEHGVLLSWSKWDGKRNHTFSSKGDLRRLREWVNTTHGDPMPVGLYIPYEMAWKAVKEFLENDGALPKSIAWIANSDLPPNTFPDP